MPRSGTSRLNLSGVFRPDRGLRARLRGSALRPSLDEASRLLGLTDPRLDREPGPLTIKLGVPGTTALTVIDQRGETPRTYHLDAEAEDLAERLAAIRGGRPGLNVRILVDPASCFIRTLTLPSAALPRMRAVLAQELEAATPFRSEAVHGDWYVEGEDAETATLRVRHVVLKRARLAPLLGTLDRAGLQLDAIVVGAAEDRTMPLDLLSDGHRALPGFLRGAGAGNLALVGGALLLTVVAFLSLRAQQEATLAGLDQAFLAARRAAGPSAKPLVQAGAAAILSERGPPLARTWDAIAAALPDAASAQSLRVDAEGLVLTLVAPDEAAVLGALGNVAGFGKPALREATPFQGGRWLVVALPRMPGGKQP